MGVLLQGFFFAPGRAHGVPSPLDGDRNVPFWWNHLAAQAHELKISGFTAVWLPSPLKGASGGFSSGYDVFDDYDLGSKDQKGTIPTRHGSREQLERCVAVMRANGLDVYVDMVENHRDGDDGHFNFAYVNASGQHGKGRFAKGPNDFHPHVPPDPGVFDDRFQFGRDLAPINGAGGHVFRGLLDAGDWLTRALDIQGYRLDDVKGVSTQFLLPFLNHGAMANKFAVGEFFDGNIGLIQGWMGAIDHRASAFDFPLRFLLQKMCNEPGNFNMASLDRSGLTGADPLGSVTFVENHDTDSRSGAPIVRNKMLAYAYILTGEGYPCVFYRDYSKDKDCFGLKDKIDRLIWIHEQLAAGPTQQRWKDEGVFAFERLGGAHLLVALNKDPNVTRTINVQTGFAPKTRLRDFAEHAPDVGTDDRSIVKLNIPKNAGGLGYVCYSLPRPVTPFPANHIPVSQDYEGDSDLDIRPSVDTERVQACRIFTETDSDVEAHLFFDTAHWSAATSLQLDAEDSKRKNVAGRNYNRTTAQGAAMKFVTRQKGFHAFFVQTKNPPSQNHANRFRLRLTYSAPQSI